MQGHQEKITVNVVSLGCPKNLVDSEVMMGLLDKDDFHIVPPDHEARVSVINTCSFVEGSKQESIDTILEVAERKKAGQLSLLVVAGCLAQRYAQNLPELLPEVDLFVGVGEYPKLPGLIRHKLAERSLARLRLARDDSSAVTYVEKREYVPDHLMPRLQTTPFYTKYVKIAEGCSHRCSFCIIPHIRGDLNSRAPEDISAEIKDGVGKGVKEFNLVSQDLNEYGRDLKERSSLTKLLEKISTIEGDFWLRPMYMYPLQFPDKLVRLIADETCLVKYVDIPLQHISDRMLKKMNRGSSGHYIRRLIDNLKSHVPGIVLRTTFIVGHPGETKDDFAQLKKFLTDTEFDRVGVFKYSHEEGTPSYYMTDQVSEDLKEERFHELMTLQKKISLKKNKRLIGSTVKVLFEGVSKESDMLFSGRTAGQAPDIDGVVLINEGQAKVGEFCQVTITEAHSYDLLGKVVSN